jgi:hypothetical protein
MNRFRTIFAVFLLMIFTFNVFIYYSLFEVADYSAKNEMADQVHQVSSLRRTTVLKLPLNRLKDAKSGELWFNNEMYDVVKAEVKNDCILVYALADKKEGELITEFGKQLENNTDLSITKTGSAQAPAKQHKTPLQKYVPSAAPVSATHSMLTKVIYYHLRCFYSTPVKVIQAPPPERTVS